MPPLETIVLLSSAMDSMAVDQSVRSILVSALTTFLLNKGVVGQSRDSGALTALGTCPDTTANARLV